MYRLNNAGDSALPCLTPPPTRKGEDGQPFHRTAANSFGDQLQITSVTEIGILASSSTLNNLIRLTLSNAFFISKAAAHTQLP